MHYKGKLKLRSHNTSYCFIEVVTKAGLTVSHIITVMTLIIHFGHNFFYGCKKVLFIL